MRTELIGQWEGGSCPGYFNNFAVGLVKNTLRPLSAFVEWLEVEQLIPDVEREFTLDDGSA